MSNKNIEEENKKLKTLVKELNSQRHQLINSNKLKDIFLANMSHELKTPLNSINVISSVMQKNKNNTLDKEQIKNLQIINECGNDLLHLINEILDISKLEAGEMLLSLEQVDIKETLLGLKDMFEPLTHNKGLQFECEFDEDVRFINTDKNKVRQIIKNLLSNALKFVSKGKIRLRLQQRDNNVYFTVKDDGIGISKDNFTQIFDRFQQAQHNSSKNFGGSGLGLAISKELAHLLGGDIHVDSKVDKGTTFTLILPLSLKKENVHVQDRSINVQDTIAVKNIEKESCTTSCQTKDILVVSQNHVLLFTSLIKVKKMGFNIRQFDEIKDALILLNTVPYDILILNLPQGESCEEILLKAKELKMKIVIITENKTQIKEADFILTNKEVEQKLVSSLLKM